MSENFQQFMGLSPVLALAALAVGLVAGLIKGLVGFAMPMVLISGLTLFLPPDIALAALILPTFVSNGVQALGQGFAAAWGSVQRFWLFLAVGGVCLVISAQFVRVLDPEVMLLLIGVPICAFGLVQLLGWRLRLGPRGRRPAEVVIAVIAGGIGGISGVWGPPTVLYLTAMETPKVEQMRAQGVIYGLGAALLLVTHVQSGVLRWETVPLSVSMLAPVLMGMWLGMRLQGGLDQERFRRLTLMIVVIMGANLVRRGLMG